MLNLSAYPQAEALRSELQVWLRANPPPVPKTKDLSDFVAIGRAWQQKLASGRWVGVHWPSEFGGRSLSLVEEAIVQEELVKVNAPQILGLFGLTMVGPLLVKHGTQAQKSAHLSKILSAEEIWCQGFSEPGAGSDLAAVKTKAEVREDGFHITGQKVWTSFAHVAHWCFLLCRTSEEKEKHKGLSYLLVNMKTPGISVRPLKQISGDEEFNEVFFDDVVVPHENIVGKVGDGWKMAISTLMFERVVLTFARQIQSEVTLRALARKYGTTADEAGRAALSYEIARAAAVRSLAYEHLLLYSTGTAPGPEGSLDKLFWSESFQRISKLALYLRGAKSVFLDSEEGEEDVHRYLYSRGRTIAAGTSEIQRSIIAERILGLPRGR